MAVKLGILHVNAMLRSLTAKEYMEWMAYARSDPFAEFRADYRAASIVQILANINRGKDTAACSIEDVVLKFDTEPKKPQTWEEQEAIFKMIAAGFKAEAQAKGH